MNYQEEMNKAAITTCRAFETWGLGHLMSSVTLEWNTRFKSRAGDATWNKKTKTGRIRLSTQLWKHLSEKDRYETVVHETAHIAAFVNHPTTKRGRRDVHGWAWQSYMRKMGLKPERCHSLDVYKLGLSKRRQQYTATCQCKTHTIGQTIVNRMTNGKKYRCPKCGMFVRLQSVQPIK